MDVACTQCKSPYPSTGAPHVCTNCGGLFDYSFDSTQRATSRAPGGWPVSEAVSLGEGHTPLVRAKVFGRDVWFKCEYQNPTGSFKDRGTAALISFLVSRGVTEAVEDSSGNAGASFAAYAARAGIRAKVFVPSTASGPKLAQIKAYGAELVSVDGPRANASLAAQKETESGAVYASHAHMPFTLAGYSTIAHEIVEQLGGMPSALILPAGQGGLLLGAWRGFLSLNPLGARTEATRIVGVQAEACSPLAKDEGGKRRPAEGVEGMKDEGRTVAEGVRVANPLRSEAVRQAVKESGGRWIAVPEDAIMAGRDALARQGLYVEPTSGLVWHALEQVLIELRDPVVVVLTGSGLKFLKS